MAVAGTASDLAMTPFTEAHERFRARVRSVFERVLVPNIETWERDRSFPTRAVLGALAKEGLIGLEYSDDDGGQSKDHLYTVILGEELGKVGCNGVAMAITIQTDMATPSLAQYGSRELKERYLRPALRGEAVAAIAITEPDAGSDIGSLRGRAVQDGDEWVIDAEKQYITNGAQADWICVLVRTSGEGGTHGMTQIIVPADAPGFSVVRRLNKLGGRSVDTAALRFDGCRVPFENAVGTRGRGFQQQMRQLVRERMIVNYVAVAEAETAIARTIEFLRGRVAFGKPLIESQHLQFTLADLIAQVDVLRQYNYACAAALVRGEDIGRASTIAKLFAGRLQRKVADVCVQLHGGRGYLDDEWPARYFRDSRLLSIGGGTDEIMLRILTRLEGMPVGL